MKQLKTNSITITYLSKITFSSLNGSDKEVDNINPIKKISLFNGEEAPYISSQAIRRALRDKLEEMGFEISLVQEASVKKGAPKTQLDPEKFIDDDLFGFMDASAGSEGGKGKSTIRTSPVRVESLVSLNKYYGDLDFATNFMGKKYGIDPNIFETEIHSGFYRGSILIELDRIGKGEGFGEKSELSNEEKKNRVIGFINALQNLWSSGRQTRFLADISPKFIAAAYMKTKNPIFLESVNINNKFEVNIEELQGVVEDYKDYIEEYVFAAQSSIFKVDNTKSLNDGFNNIKNWIELYYKES